MEDKEHSVIQKVGLAIFKNKKILMARYKGIEIFYFVGGKLRAGESELECLIRKVPDEITADLAQNTAKFLGEFEDIADGTVNTRLRIKLYEGKLLGESRPNNDVEEVRYFDTSDMTGLSVIAKNKIFPWLKEHEYIN